MGIRDKFVNKSKKRAVAKLKKETTDNQIKFLSDALDSGVLSARVLRRQLVDNAYKEMRKGVDKLSKNGSAVTVDALLVEYWQDKAFRELCERVELSEEWFIDLARSECEKRGGK